MTYFALVVLTNVCKRLISGRCWVNSRCSIGNDHQVDTKEERVSRLVNATDSLVVNECSMFIGLEWLISMMETMDIDFRNQKRYAK